jgi:hypothetical protein
MEYGYFMSTEGKKKAKTRFGCDCAPVTMGGHMYITPRICYMNNNIIWTGSVGKELSSGLGMAGALVVMTVCSAIRHRSG